MCPSKQRLAEFKHMMKMIEAYSAHKGVAPKTAAEQLSYQQSVYQLPTLASVRSALKAPEVSAKWSSERLLSAVSAETRASWTKRKADDYQQRKVKKEKTGTYPCVYVCDLVKSSYCVCACVCVCVCLSLSAEA